MICKKCGISVPDNKSYCDNCALPNSYGSLENNKKSESWVNFKNIAYSIFIVILIVAGFSSRILRLVNNRSANQKNQVLKEIEAGNYEKGIEELKKSLEIAIDKNDKITILSNIAYTYAENGKEDLAKQYFNEALKLTSQNSFEYSLFSGELDLLDKNFDSAIDNFKKAYSLKAEPEINQSIAYCYFEKGDDINAKTYLQKAKDLGVKLYPDEEAFLSGVENVK